MEFKVGETVRIREDDPGRGGEIGTVRQLLPQRPGSPSIQEYLLEFKSYPAKLRTSSDRFFLCIYREEELAKR